nr:hypothetical protein [Candidatus Njordarchaeota archaeon]
MSTKHLSGKEQTPPKSHGAKQQPRGYKLYRVSLYFCIAGSFLIIAEGVILALVSPLFYGVQLLSPWGGYIDLLLGIIMLIGLLLVVRLHNRKTTRTVGATSIGLSAIISLILFGGGFYLGFILGLIGGFLTATKE